MIFLKNDPKIINSHILSRCNALKIKLEVESIHTCTHRDFRLSGANLKKMLPQILKSIFFQVCNKFFSNLRLKNAENFSEETKNCPQMIFRSVLKIRQVLFFIKDFFVLNRKFLRVCLHHILHYFKDYYFMFNAFTINNNL